MIDLISSNTEILKWLFEKKSINALEWKDIYIGHIRPQKVNTDRVVGMLLGVAIGDSLGNTSEILTPDQRNKKYGLIKSYLPNKHASNKRIGLPSDDTQLTFDTVKVILETGSVNPTALARIFASHHIDGLGGTVKQFLKNYREEGLPWYKTGTAKASNGSLMRISPVIIPNLKSKENFLVDAILDTMMTHNDPLAIASSVAFTDMLWTFVNNEKTINRNKIIERFCFIIEKVTGNETYETRDIGTKYKGDAATFIKEQIYKAIEDDLEVKEFGKKVGSGAFLLETVPTAIYIISKFLDDPQNAIIQAVNFTKDNDTIASIVGAAMGSLHGKSAFRKEWIADLSGRLLRHSRDKEIFELLKSVENYIDSGLKK